MMSSAFRTPRRVTPAYTSLNRRYSFYFGMLFIFFIAFQVYALLSLGNSPPTSSDQSQSNGNPNSDFTQLDLEPKKGEDEYRIKPMHNKPQADNSGTVFFRTDTISQTNGFVPPVPNAVPSSKIPIKVPPSPLAHSTDTNQETSKAPKASSSPSQPSKEPSPVSSSKQKESQSPVPVSPQQQSLPSLDPSKSKEPAVAVTTVNTTETTPQDTKTTVPEIGELATPTSSEEATIPETSSIASSVTDEPSTAETSSSSNEVTVEDSQPTSNVTALSTSVEVSPSVAQQEESEQPTKELPAESTPTEDTLVLPSNTTESVAEQGESNNSTTLVKEGVTEPEESTNNAEASEQEPVEELAEQEAEDEKPLETISSGESPVETGAVTTAPEQIASTEDVAKETQAQTEETSKTKVSSEQTIDWTNYTLPTTADEIALKEVSDWLKTNNKSVKVLFWDKISGFMGNHMLRLPAKCDIPCSFTESRDDYNTSQAVVFHIPQFSDFPHHTVADQLWVAYSMESEQYYTRLKDQKFMSNFNLTMTYKLSSDIMAGYFNSNATYYMAPPYSKNETGYGLAAFIASNCVQPRLNYVKELSKHISVDSLGKCMHNKDFPNLNISNGGLLKFHTMKRYKFYLAFENHEAPDYVTEKFFHAIAAGTVPVYWGAPNIDQYMPSNHSVINVRDFDSAEKLAEYLKYLDENPSEYEKYLEWKKTGPSQQFLDLISKQKLDARCRLCIRAAEQLRQVEEASSALPSDVQ